MNSVVTRRQQIERRRDQQRKNRRIAALALIGALLLGVAAFLSLQQRGDAQAAAEYGSDDVATDGPFVAEHEMGGGQPIPFLPGRGPQPNIVVPETFFDFGQIGPEDVVEQTFVIRNDGEAPLTISRAYTTCGCTTAEFSASVIPPGKAATVKVIFDAGFHDAAGQTVRRGVIMENNDPDQSQEEI